MIDKLEDDLYTVTCDWCKHSDTYLVPDGPLALGQVMQDGGWAKACGFQLCKDCGVMGA